MKRDAGRFETLKLGQLREHPKNVRRTFSGLDDLAASIERHGVLQPIVASPPDADGLHEIIFGHRRYRAATKAGLKEIPVIIRAAADVAILEEQLVENLQREGLNPMEEAEGYGRLRDEHGYGVAEIAAATNKSQASIYAALKLLDLGAAGRKALHAGKLDASRALLVARIKGENMQERALDQILKTDRRGDVMTYRQAADFLERTYPTSSPRGVKAQRAKASAALAKDDGRASRESAVRQAMSIVVDRVQRKAHLEPAELRLMVLALLRTSAAATVAARRGVDEKRLASSAERKMTPAELRGLLFELAVTPWLGSSAAEYSTEAKVLAKTFGVSLRELESAAEHQERAAKLFAK